MSQAAPSRTVASTSGDVRNHDIKLNTHNKQDVSRDLDSHRGGYKPHGQGVRGYHGREDGDPFRHSNQRGGRYDGHYKENRHQNTRGGKNKYNREEGDPFKHTDQRGYYRENKYQYTRDRDQRQYTREPNYFRGDGPENSSSGSAFSLDDIYDKISNEHMSGVLEKKNDKQRGQSTDGKTSTIPNNTGKENRGRGQRHGSNDSRKTNTQKNHNDSRKTNTQKNQSNWIDPGSLNEFQRGVGESLYNGSNRKKPRQPTGENNRNNSGPPKKRLEYKQERGGQDNRKSLLNEISSVLVQAKSYPELFSYEQLCQELLQQRPIKVSKEQNKGQVEELKKRKRTPFLKNGVKLISNDNRGQGNIPNEFKRRKKPSRMTILNRIRKGIPVNSDDEDYDDYYLLKKQKTGDEKKKIVLETIQRISRERSEQAAKEEITDNIVSNLVIENCTAGYSKSDRVSVMNNTKSRSCDSESSFDDSEDEKEQRKSEAQKLSSNLSNDLAQYMMKVQEPKDLNLSDLKNIIQARSFPDSAEKSLSKIDEKHLVNQLENLNLNDSNLMINSVLIGCKLRDGAIPREEMGELLDEKKITNKKEELAIDEGIQKVYEKTDQASTKVMTEKEKINAYRIIDNVEVKETENPIETHNGSNEPTNKEETTRSIGKNKDTLKVDREEIHHQTVAETDLQNSSSLSEISTENHMCGEPQIGIDEIVTCDDVSGKIREICLKQTIPTETYDNISKHDSYDQANKLSKNLPTDSNNPSLESRADIDNNIETKVMKNEDRVIENRCLNEVTSVIFELKNINKDFDKNVDINATVNDNDEFEQPMVEENQVMENEVKKVVEDGEMEYGEKIDGEISEESEDESDYESDDEDEIDDDNAKILKSLTEELFASGKDASNQNVIELLQEKMKRLALNKERPNAQDAAQCPQNQAAVAPHHQNGKGDAESYSSDRPTASVENDSDVIVCDDTSDDDDDESEDDDDFPIVIVKENRC